MDNEKDWEEEI